MKDTELKLISELMKNSRRSDRELARSVGVSQPTVSRALKKLEREGYIKEYTIIPDFVKLGFEILTFTQTRMRKDVSPEAVENMKKMMQKKLEQDPVPDMLHMAGMGVAGDRILVTLHKDFSSFIRFADRLGQNPLLTGDKTTFMVDLKDEARHFRSLSMSQVASYLLKTKAEEKLKAQSQREKEF